MQPFMFTASNLSTFTEIKEEAEGEKKHSTSAQKEDPMAIANGTCQSGRATLR